MSNRGKSRAAPRSGGITGHAVAGGTCRRAVGMSTSAPEGPAGTDSTVGVGAHLEVPDATAAIVAGVRKPVACWREIGAPGSDDSNAGAG